MEKFWPLGDARPAATWGDTRNSCRRLGGSPGTSRSARQIAFALAVTSERNSSSLGFRVFQQNRPRAAGRARRSIRSKADCQPLSAASNRSPFYSLCLNLHELQALPTGQVVVQHGSHPLAVELVLHGVG